MREPGPRLTRDDSEAALAAFVDEMMPILKPCVLIALAVGLAISAGPPTEEHLSATVLVDGHGTRSAAATVHHVESRDSNASVLAQRNISFRLPLERRTLGSTACPACRATEMVVRNLDAGPANTQMTRERANSSQLICPGLIGALGTRVARRTLQALLPATGIGIGAAAPTNSQAGRRLNAANREAKEMRRQRLARATAEAAAYAAATAASEASTNSSGDAGSDEGPTAVAAWIDACGVPHRNSQWAERAAVRGHAPLVFVYGFMERLHEELLAQPASKSFFDPWHEHNQFLSEWAFHRSLLASALVTRDPAQASFFFVPFYSRMALAGRKDLHGKMVAALAAGLRSSPYWRRSHGRDHIVVVSSTRPMETLFKHAHPLVAPSILLKVELGDTRRKSDRRTRSYVPSPKHTHKHAHTLLSRH